ncbi:tectonic-like complex member MKS1 isoform X2 [Anthonomus grandis grandis]|uniref:tectonic-like complex member MKS1 isoform X2 n=1 Tax=Anthonomus grandis grandis TaxID=2921223 RepID=UPI0021665337|nr:tectonic-like complex member MKS1 isoform X2 [Anthonomus grandis grandis]
MEFITETVVKSTGVYRCIDDIRNLQIRIKIQEVQQHQNSTKNKENNSIEKVFLWQEKYFSKSQKQYYADERNCFTEQEKEFNRLVCEDSEEDINDGFLFSYIDSEEFYAETERPSGNDTNYLETRLQNLNIDDNELDSEEYDFNKSLEKTIEQPVHTHKDIKMYLLADFGEYFEDTWIKNEKLLCTLKYNPSMKVLQVFPDFTVSRPYKLSVPRSIQNDEKVFSYFIENCSKEIPESIGLNEKSLIREINEYQEKLKIQMLPDSFKLPPKNKLYVFLLLEISSGTRFEYPEVFVQYFIDLPEGWNCENDEILRGTTQTCKANEDGLVHFGHCIEALIEYNCLNSEGLPKCPYIYFEIFSKDSWERFRTEGLSYINLPISQSGYFQYDLNCFRFTTKNPISEMKRYFIGDCQNYSDVTWIGMPKDYSESVMNKYGTETVSTGQLKVRIHVLHQSQEFIEERSGDPDRTRKIISETLGSSALIRSVEQVIQEFKRARKEMLEVRRNLKM